MIKKKDTMNRKHPLGVDGVSSPDEDEYPLPPFTPPKIKTKKEEKVEKKEKPSFIVRLYKRMTKKKAL